jgi:NTP pyrophosphatase (non-canonical NTP hydrolase)
MKTFIEYGNFVANMKVYPNKYNVIYPTLGLTGEAGEIAEKVKKWIRDGGGEVITEDRREAILKELGDPLWYITAIAADLGYTLQDVVDANVDKLTSRKERGVLQGSGDNR